jgi:hypothetical protein
MIPRCRFTDIAPDQIGKIKVSAPHLLAARPGLLTFGKLFDLTAQTRLAARIAQNDAVASGKMDFFANVVCGLP